MQEPKYHGTTTRVLAAGFVRTDTKPARWYTSWLLVTGGHGGGGGDGGGVVGVAVAVVVVAVVAAVVVVAVVVAGLNRLLVVLRRPLIICTVHFKTVEEFLSTEAVIQASFGNCTRTAA